MVCYKYTEIGKPKRTLVGSSSSRRVVVVGKNTLKRDQERKEYIQNDTKSTSSSAW